MAKAKKENRGGKRENAGRRLKYGEPTIPVNYRIPKSMKPVLDNYVTRQLLKYERAAKGSS